MYFSGYYGSNNTIDLVGFVVAYRSLLGSEDLRFWCAAGSDVVRPLLRGHWLEPMESTLLGAYDLFQQGGAPFVWAKCKAMDAMLRFLHKNHPAHQLAE